MPTHIMVRSLLRPPPYLANRLTPLPFIPLSLPLSNNIHAVCHLAVPNLWSFVKKVPLDGPPSSAPPASTAVLPAVDAPHSCNNDQETDGRSKNPVGGTNGDGQITYSAPRLYPELPKMY